MNLFRRIAYRLQPILQRRQIEADLAEEMRVHLEMATEANVAAGMPPEEARRAALRACGGVDQAKESWRDERYPMVLEHLWKDLRFAIRSLARSPGFTVTVVATLAVGIGATTAMVSIARQALLPSLPFPDEKGLVTIKDFNTRENRPYPVYSPRYVAFRAQTKSFLQLGAAQSEMMNLVVDGQPFAMSVEWVTPGTLSAFGIQPMLGRSFAPEDYRPGSDGQAVLLSYQAWQQQFGANIGVIGREVLLGGKPRHVVGVMPESVRNWPSTGYSWQLCLPLADESLDTPESGFSHLTMVSVAGRLKPGISMQQAQAELAATRMPAGPESQFWAALTPRLAPIRERYITNSSQLIWVFLGAAECLYAISCSNAVNLMLVRTVTRRRELAMRLALGGSRRQLIRLLLVESVLLTGLGGAAGLWLAGAGHRAFGEMLLNADVSGLDRPTLVTTLAVCLGTGLLLGLAPALRIGRANLQEALKEGAGSFGDSRRLQRLRSGFVVLQAALATTLMIGGGLMTRTFIRLQRTGVGFDTANTYAMWASLPDGPPNGAFLALSDRIGIELNRLPGVESAALATAPPMKSTYGYGNSVSVVGKPERGKIGYTSDETSAEYFATLGIPLRMGHGFAGLRRGDPPVAVVNDGLVRRLFPNSNPLGQRLEFGGGFHREIIGVVPDVREEGTRHEAAPHIYVPIWERTSSKDSRNYYLYALLRLRGKPMAGFEASVRKAVYAVDPRIVTSFWKLEDYSIQTERSTLTVLRAMSGLSLVLATTGLFALMAYAVAQRTREFGVRMALGAAPRDLLRLVLRGGLALAASGIAAGLGVAWAATRFLGSVLYQTSPYDPPVYLGVAGVLLVVAAAACWLPARRASRVNPNEALRAE